PSVAHSPCAPRASAAERQTACWHRRHRFSPFTLAFLTVFLFPVGEQIGALSQAAHDAVHVGLGDGLKDDAAKLVFEKLDAGAGRNPMLAPEFRRYYKLAFGGKRST